MKHELTIIPCPSCELKLYECDQRIQDWFRKSVKRSFPEIHISWGFRNQIDQDKMYSKKKSDLTWPKSKHNRLLEDRPASQAVDLFALSKDGKAQFNLDIYQAIWDLVKQENQQISWGGNFRLRNGTIDSCHFQLK